MGYGRTRVPIELMFKDKKFINFAAEHYKNLWELAWQTSVGVDPFLQEEGRAGIGQKTIAIETFRMLSQPLVYVYEAYLHRSVIPELNEEQRKEVEKAEKSLKESE